MRVGTCASVSPKVSLGDMVIPNGAVKMEGVSLHYLPVEFPSVPDFQCLSALNRRLRTWIIRTTWALPLQRRPFTHRPGRRQSPWDRAYVQVVRLRKGGATSTSMECPACSPLAPAWDPDRMCDGQRRNCRNYSDNGRNTEIDIVEDRAIGPQSKP